MILVRRNSEIYRKIRYNNVALTYDPGLFYWPSLVIALGL